MTPRTKAAAKADVAARERAGRVPDDAAVSALLDSLIDGVSALPEVLEQGEKARRMRAESARELLASPELKELAHGAPDIRSKITAARREQDRKDAEAEQSLTELREASEEWLAGLKSLRELGR